MMLSHASRFGGVDMVNVRVGFFSHYSRAILEDLFQLLSRAVNAKYRVFLTFTHKACHDDGSHQ
jgi:hypothetical protein